jgi:hypothetical protein
VKADHCLVEDKWVCSQKAVKDDGLEKEEEEKVYL